MIKSERRFRVGIAGYGVVGVRRHEVMKSHPSLEVVAVCDQKFEAPFVRDNVEHVQQYQQLLERDLDILFVCLPNDIASAVACAGLERDLHVFCEKPPGRNVEDIRQVIEVERRKPGLKLKYGFNHRYHESVRDAQKIISSGEFGRLINMRGVYGKSAFTPWPRDVRGWRTERAIAGGGILLDQGIHMLDLMRYFAGEFVEVKSFVSNSFWNLDVEDNAYALMKSREGVVAFLHSTATQWRHRFNLEIFMERGALILSGILSGTKSYGQESLSVVYRSDEANGDPREVRSTYNQDPSWRDEIFDFIECVVQDQPVTIGSSDDALKTMELVYDIYLADPEWRQKYEIKR